LTHHHIKKELNAFFLHTGAERRPWRRQGTAARTGREFERQRQEQGFQAISELLGRRVEPARFDSGQTERLIVASGGYLRDLFSLVQEAAYCRAAQ